MPSASRSPRRHRPRRRADMPLLGGIRPPIAALLVLLLAVAALTTVLLPGPVHGAVPKAVLDSQQRVAEDGATTLRASLDEGTTDLRRAAALFSASKPVPAQEMLDTLGTVYRKWRGTAVVGVADGHLLAARGENVPLSAINRDIVSDDLAPRLVRLESGETRLLMFALVTRPGQKPQLLVASDSLQVPAIRTGGTRTLHVVSHRGEILAASGPRKGSASAAALARTAAHRTARPAADRDGGFDGTSGSLLGERSGGHRIVAGYASPTPATDHEGRVTSPASALRLTVLTEVDVEPAGVTGNARRLLALIAAAALLLLAIAVTWALTGALQRPLLRLHLEARRLARHDLQRPVDVPRFGEPARIGAALEWLRTQLLYGAEPAPPAASRRRPGIRTLLAVCAVLLLAWSGSLLFLLSHPAKTAKVPAGIVVDQRERTGTAADRVRQGLGEAYADLASVATLLDDASDPAAARSALETVAREHKRYRSLYLLGRDGSVVARTGSTPLRGERPAPAKDRVRLENSSGKIPVIAAYAHVPGTGGAVVVGELDSDFLTGLLSRPGLGEVRLLDAKGRTLAANRGIRAFERPGDARLLALADRTQGAALGTVLRGEGTPAVAAAAPLKGAHDTATAGLDWKVTSAQPISWLDLSVFQDQRRLMLAGLLGLAAATACLGWLHIVVVRPLRALAEAAEALSAGDRRTVLFPRHHDEVGSVVRSLEVIRQQLADQARTAPTARI